LGRCWYRLQFSAPWIRAVEVLVRVDRQPLEDDLAFSDVELEAGAVLELDQLASAHRRPYGDEWTRGAASRRTVRSGLFSPASRRRVVVGWRSSRGA